ncbi:type II toxin-antitoxin system VapC family toxin [Verrucomicrobiota bacterium]
MLLLDTHAFVWLVSDQKQFTSDALNAVSANAGRLHLSSVSGLEIGLLVKRDRLVLPTAPDVFIRRGMTQHHIQEMPMTWEIAYRSSCLPELHNDPFDRIIIATAQLNGMDILSKDRMIPTYPGTKVIW